MGKLASEARAGLPKAGYVGALAEGKPHGAGKYRLPSGAVFEGEFEAGEKAGHGTYRWPDGSVYVGQYADDKPNGEGRKHFASTAATYEGTFANGNAQGHGTKTFWDGGLYVGEWKGGKVDGAGRYVYADGDVYEGEYVRGRRHGTGCYTFGDGVVAFDGQWLDNQPAAPKTGAADGAAAGAPVPRARRPSVDSLFARRGSVDGGGGGRARGGRRSTTRPTQRSASAARPRRALRLGQQQGGAEELEGRIGSGRAMTKVHEDLTNANRPSERQAGARLGGGGAALPERVADASIDGLERARGAQVGERAVDVAEARARDAAAVERLGIVGAAIEHARARRLRLAPFVELEAAERLVAPEGDGEVGGVVARRRRESARRVRRFVKVGVAQDACTLGVEPPRVGPAPGRATLRADRLQPPCPRDEVGGAGELAPPRRLPAEEAHLEAHGRARRHAELGVARRAEGAPRRTPARRPRPCASPRRRARARARRARAS